MKAIEQKVIDTVRVVCADGVEKANSGHPGIALGAAPAFYALWKNMSHNPKNPAWVNRDRFVLSAGHGSMLLYTMMHLFGYGLTMDDLKSFRQLGSKTPGHPEYSFVPGIETTTGPLGQGIANGVGMAIAEARLAAQFNKPGHEIVDHFTYVLCGDGCMMEGISYEAASLAGTLKLGKLIIIYDSNDVSIEGDISIAFTENVGDRFKACGWQVLRVENGNDIGAVEKALEKAKSDTSAPTMIEVKTIIGYGSDKAGSESSHGEPLGGAVLAGLKKNLGMPEQNFCVDSDVYEYMKTVTADLAENEQKWNAVLDEYKLKFKDSYNTFCRWISGEFPVGELDSPEFWEFSDKPAATRNSSGEMINRLRKIFPNMIGGSADLAASNRAVMEEAGVFSAEDYTCANIYFGVREHVMAAIANGIGVHGGLLPYIATFFVFSDYLKPAMRMSAIMNLPVTYVFTHDSIGVGEDGSTHQPIEQLAAMRSIPGFIDFRPADARETAAGWYTAVTNGKNPVGLVLTRQTVPQYPFSSGRKALRGAYIIKESKKDIPDVILIASGSEVEHICNAVDMLEKQGIGARAVSMPSMALFEKQDDDYKESVLPRSVTARVAVEAASSFGWHKYIGFDGGIVCMDTFGVSAPSDVLFKHFGFTSENVAEKAKEVINR
ncbi:MAG: transketolase [Oscillospiraceae bacterium]|nr:transketolase [Oscillospiraceae bacterium]